MGLFVPKQYQNYELLHHFLNFLAPLSDNSQGGNQ
jgi:hypothetical protein